MIRFEDGKIVTDLSDCALFDLIWRRWAKFNEAEVDALWAKITTQEMTDEWLKHEGFVFWKKTSFPCSESICLIKVGYREWMIKDSSPSEMKTFVRKFNTRRKYEELSPAFVR